MGTAPQWFVNMLPSVNQAFRTSSVAAAVRLAERDEQIIGLMRSAAINGDRLAAAQLWDLLEDAGSAEVWYLGVKLPIAEARALAGV